MKKKAGMVVVSRGRVEGLCVHIYVYIYTCIYQVQSQSQSANTITAPKRPRPSPAPATCILAPLLVDGDDPAVEEAEGAMDPDSPVAVGPPGTSVADV